MHTSLLPASVDCVLFEGNSAVRGDNVAGEAGEKQERSRGVLEVGRAGGRENMGRIGRGGNKKIQGGRGSREGRGRRRGRGNSGSRGKQGV